MIALDTNIVVRLLVADDAGQTGRARRLLESEDCFLSKTVLLETDWVLRSRYGRSPAEVATALDALTRLERIRMEDEAGVRQAFAWAAAGMGFADALHLASAPAGASFATFDQALARLARAADGTPEIAAV